MVLLSMLLNGAAHAQVRHLAADPGKAIWPGIVVQEGPSGGLLSIARFTVAPGRSDPPSHMHHAEEWFLIESGHGTVWLDGRASSVGPGDVVRVAAPVVRRIAAAPDGAMVFEAITSPAFSLDDYVPDGQTPRD